MPSFDPALLSEARVAAAYPVFAGFREDPRVGAPLTLATLVLGAAWRAIGG